MGISFSRYPGIFNPEPFEKRNKAGEDKWLKIEDIPCEEGTSTMTNKTQVTSKTSSKYGGRQVRNVFAITVSLIFTK